ncbi:spermatogenesis-defective protein 39 homolog [Sitophilus oryzae]|uniref:Spermatogenesis-defective protein 39 homolog n=1 Tax=Sitophilus oryzae TaxID=7048 RepID=A0A6J2XD10_SITOR|nr:spermatogenesis-defective protein 39 homolog [Sitophilus oryzae]
MAKSEDDFWNTSSHSGFNFDEDEDTEEQANDNVLFHSLEENVDLPIHLLISKHGLDILLENVRSTLPTIVPPIEETIKKMVHGHKYNLHCYVKFQDKMNLLDQALQTYDANVILKVITYIKTTLKKNIFFHQISKRKVAVKHYAYHLITKNLLEELADFYMATGNSNLLTQIFYLTAHGMVVNKTYLHKKLQCNLEHLLEINPKSKSEISDNLQLINYQLEKNFKSTSVINQLVELCKAQPSTAKGMEDILEFKKYFRIDDFTFDWTITNVFCTMKLWSNLKDYFIKSNWLTKKNSLKTSISAEAFLELLHKHDAPKEVLEQVLGCFSDSERALYFANLYKCHTFIIQYYVQQKDRQALIHYREKIVPYTPEYYLIDISLQTMEGKKRN